MNNETNTTPNVNENSDLQTTQEHSERPHLLEGQGFSLLRYFTTDQETFDEVELFEECIAPLAGVIARKCDELGIPCYMVFAVRCNAEEAAFVDWRRKARGKPD